MKDDLFKKVTFKEEFRKLFRGLKMFFDGLLLVVLSSFRIVRLFFVSFSGLMKSFGEKVESNKKKRDDSDFIRGMKRY